MQDREIYDTPGFWFYFSFVTAVFSFVFVYVLLTDDHVNNVSYFPFMSIKKIVPYFCVLREGHYVIIGLLLGLGGGGGHLT